MPTYCVRYAKGVEAFEQDASLTDDVAARAFGEVLARHFAKPHRGRHLFAGWLLTVSDETGRAVWRDTIWPKAADDARLH